MVLSFVLNCAIAAMVEFSFFAMFTGWDFMKKKGKYEEPGGEMFQYFTIDSNVLMGFCSLIVAVAQIPVLFGKQTELSPVIYGIKLMGSAAVMLTFVVTVCFLVPQFKNPMELFYNSNLFFHLVVPLTAAGSFVFTEKTTSLPFSATLIGIVPTCIYEVYYVVNIFTHLNDGKVDKKYDFYNFLNGNKALAPIAGTIVLLVSYLLALLLWWANRVCL